MFTRIKNEDQLQFMVPEESEYWKEAMEIYYDTNEHAYANEGYPLDDRWVLTTMTPQWTFKGFFVNLKGQQSSETTLLWDATAKSWTSKVDKTFKAKKDIWKKARYFDRARMHLFLPQVQIDPAII